MIVPAENTEVDTEEAETSTGRGTVVVLYRSGIYNMHTTIPMSLYMVTTERASHDRHASSIDHINYTLRSVY
jgi:hypothetical protein